jgi:hypothetical protein
MTALWQGRILAWYSDGAASACMAKLAVEKYGPLVEILKCDTTSSEHPDNLRFRREVESWIGREITLISSEKYADVNEVFERTGYMAGIYGARCTVELKKLPRFTYQDVADTHLFGFTADEHKRISEFEKNNPELYLEWILRDQNITKAGCFRMLSDAGIKRPVMYDLGFKNNNCLGCVKATSPKYWNRIRAHFPEVFQRRCEQSRRLGVRLTRVRGQRIFLDELPLDAGKYEAEPDISCGPQCQAA